MRTEEEELPLELNTGSPCKRICRLMDERCTGCGRTLQVIATWSKLSPEQRHRANTEASHWLKNEGPRVP